MKTALPILDKNLAVEKTAGNEQLAEQLLALLLKELPGYKQELQQALAQENRQQLHNLLHKLHGGLRYVGAPALTEVVAYTDKQVNDLLMDELAIHLKAIYYEMERVLKIEKY